LTRKLIGAFLPRAAATSLSAVNSSSDSTLNIKMPAASASSISCRFLPTPEKTIFLGSPPAFNARNNSPPETISKPLPSSARAFNNAMLEFALTEKQTIWGTVLKASSKTRKWRFNVARL
jgi:hypothetical protein